MNNKFDYELLKICLTNDGIYDVEGLTFEQITQIQAMLFQDGITTMYNENVNYLEVVDNE